MHSSTLIRGALPVLVSGVFLVGVAQAAPAGRTVLTGSAPNWANNQNFVAGADSTADVGFRVYLGWTDAVGAAALATAVSDPHSPSYGGLMALADQKAGHAHGFANPLLYANPSAFYDVGSVKTAQRLFPRVTSSNGLGRARGQQ